MVSPNAERLPRQLLTPAEVAELLRIPVDTLYQWRYKSCGPPGLRIGRHLRYDPRAVAEWIDGLNDREGGDGQR